MYIKREELIRMVSDLSAICEVYTKYIARSGKLKQNFYKLEDGTKCFGFIPYPYTSNIIYSLTSLYNRFKHSANKWPKFLDIGCGIGNIVLLADLIGFTADGLEYDPKIYKVAKDLERPRSTIFKGDMRKFRQYHEYDILYYYRPIVSAKGMVEFSHKLAKAMKPGTYILCYGNNEGFRQSKDFKFDENVHAWHKKEK